MTETPTTSTPDYGKAGRNLPAAIVVGVLLLALVVASLFINPVLFAFLAAFAMVLAVREMNTAVVVGLSTRMALLLQIAAVAIVFSALYADVTGLLVAFVGSAIVILTVRLFDGQDAYVHHVTRSIFILLYGPVLASFAVLLSQEDNGAWKVMALVLLTAATDLGGYIAGVLFGSHPMAPKISPKKSWEGFAGALTLQIIAGSVLWMTVFERPPYEGAIVAAIMVVTAVIGDLVESMIKRDLGIKDMSQLLPGHGGVMDRLDALLVNAFVAWVLFSLFL